MIFEQYSMVRLKKINKEFSNKELLFDKRKPQVGDLATIIEIYHTPRLGYELECSNENGITEWLITFSPEDAVFELVY